MKPAPNLRSALPAALLLGAAVAVPSHAAPTNYDDLETFMSVYERIKNNYVQDVDDHTLLKGAIDGMLAVVEGATVRKAQDEIGPVLVNGAAQILEAGDAVHGERGLVRPHEPAVGFDQDHAFGQAGDDLLQLQRIRRRGWRPRCKRWFGHVVP